MSELSVSGRSIAEDPLRHGCGTENHRPPPGRNCRYKPIRRIQTVGENERPRGLRADVLPALIVGVGAEVVYCNYSRLAVTGIMPYIAAGA